MREAGHRARHNLNYWQFGDYLGIGAGAHGKLSFPHRVVRQVRLREPAAWMAGRRGRLGRRLGERGDARPICRSSSCSMRCACATASSWRASPSAPGCPLSAIARPLEEAERRGLVTRDLHRVRPTVRGFDFLNDLLALFLPAP